MPRLPQRFAATLIAAAVFLSGAGARAGGVQAPWFGPAAGSQAAPDIPLPLHLVLRYVSFWHYADGLNWAAYSEWRLVQYDLPATYAARPATPLPDLPAQPEEVATTLAAPGTAPAPAPIPQPQPEPAPAPQPEPEPEPAPPPAPAPQPKPEPEPEPAPEPNPKPAPKPQPPADPAGLNANEVQMAALVNAERAKAGLPALTVDTRLVATARAKSQDMITGGYFDHNSPTLGSPFDQMRAAGIRYLTAGENIAGNQSVQAAHEALMNSSGHRANILSTRFNKIGIGIVAGGPYGLMVTQQFIGD